MACFHQWVTKLTVNADVILAAQPGGPNSLHTLHFQSSTMAPTKPSTKRPRTPDRTTERREHDTVKKSRFFEAYNTQHEEKSLYTICKSQKVAYTTAQRWLHQRVILGDLAHRRTRPLSEKLGRPEIVSPETYKFLVSDENSVRNQLCDFQVEYHQLEVSIRTL